MFNLGLKITNTLFLIYNLLGLILTIFAMLRMKLSEGIKLGIIEILSGNMLFILSILASIGVFQARKLAAYGALVISVSYLFLCFEGWGNFVRAVPFLAIPSILLFGFYMFFLVKYLFIESKKV